MKLCSTKNVASTILELNILQVLLGKFWKIIFLELIVFLQEAEQDRLEREMQKRRERIEKWREERRQNQAGASLPLINNQPARVWTLDDEDEDEDEDAGNQGGENGQTPEIDPLDAFMQVPYQS